MLRPVGTANRNVTVIEQRLEKRSWSRLQTKDQQLTMQIQPQYSRYLNVRNSRDNNNSCNPHNWCIARKFSAGA